jgi:hypothetical protein
MYWLEISIKHNDCFIWIDCFAISCVYNQHFRHFGFQISLNKNMLKFNEKYIILNWHYLVFKERFGAPENGFLVDHFLFCYWSFLDSICLWPFTYDLSVYCHTIKGFPPALFLLSVSLFFRAPFSFHTLHGYFVEIWNY